MNEPVGEASARGAIAWMARNPVAANLLMLLFMVGGLLMFPRIRKEVFPLIELDTVRVSVVYPGASPAEVEQGIVLAVEQAIRGLDGIRRVTSTAAEGVGTVDAEILLGANPDRVLADVKSAVDRIVTFPEDAERPVVSLLINRREVISILLYGDVDETVLRDVARRVQEEIEATPGITQVTLTGIRPVEISVEVPESRLRALGLTPGRIADEISRAVVEIGGGGVKTPTGEILLRTNERRDWGRELLDVPVISRPDGSTVRLGEIAEVRDGFAETDESFLFNGHPAARLTVYSVGRESPTEVAKAVYRFVEGLRKRLPPTIGVAIWNDRSELYRDRTRLLLQNGLQGLVLVMVTLGLFLEVRLAFWVMLGIPTSLLGCLLLLPATDISINMISLFAFIMTLGIVVDDATVIGESVYYERSRGRPPLEAAIEGTKLVAAPVVFSVLTNIIAFLPLWMIPGYLGQLWRNIPVIVTVVFLVSLAESLFILPAHLAHSRPGGRGRIWRWIEWPQEQVGRRLERFAETSFSALVAGCLRHRYLVLSVSLAALLLGIGWVGGGRMPFIFFPKVEGDIVSARVVLPYGSPVEATRAVADRLLTAAREEIEARGGSRYLRGILTAIGGSGESRGGAIPAQRGSVGHEATVTVALVPGDERPFGAQAFTEGWRRRVGEVPGVESLTFRFTLGPAQSRPVDVAISHSEPEVIEEACRRVAAELGRLRGVVEIDDGIERGKPQLDLRLTAAGRAAGLTAAELARQVRHAFFGAEARRQPRGRDELRIYVRLPLEERRREHSIETLMLRTPSGAEIPLGEAATVTRSRAYERILRLDGRRVMHVTADILTDVTDAEQVLRVLREGVLAQLQREHPTLLYSFEGEQREQREAFGAALPGFAIVLLALFGMLAVPFRSYRQAVVIMCSIPFGLLGAIVGHLLMGYQLSFVSVMGMMALSGVVINDGILLCDAANRFIAEGAPLEEAMRLAPVRRLRPVLLTSLTTFFGLAPLIVERSLQARFMIPMALSLGFGILFSTAVSLLVLPCLVLAIEDVRRWLRGLGGGVTV
ncbi:MAG: efflux RND transporter permease subunit [Kiritimatiellae bacterium]|nr:efflux RND transporter permease subunit [Kiritimatiellia bacterium]